MADNAVVTLNERLTATDNEKQDTVKPSIEQQISGISLLIRQKLEREAIIKKRKKLKAETGEDQEMSDLGEPPDWSLLLAKIVPMRSTNCFEKVKFLGDGSYSSVYKVKDKVTGEIFAMKKFKSRTTGGTNVSLTSLREFKVIMTCSHPNIVKFHELCVSPKYGNELALVMEFCGEKDLLEMLRAREKPFEKKHIKSFLFQLFSAMNYLHHKHILHRDIKLSNLMVTPSGDLKLGDFGLARGMYDESDTFLYTPLVATLWYRAPELLLGTEKYDASIDIWAAGCLFAELIRCQPLFPGKSELDQLDTIFRSIGSPTEESWPEYKNLPSCEILTIPLRPPMKDFREKLFPGVTDFEYDFLMKCLTLNPKKRMTAAEALQHPTFTELPLAEKYVAKIDDQD